VKSINNYTTLSIYVKAGSETNFVIKKIHTGHYRIADKIMHNNSVVAGSHSKTK